MVCLRKTDATGLRELRNFREMLAREFFCERAERVKVRAVESVTAPRLSVALAVMTATVATGIFTVAENGAVVAVAASPPFTRNSTFTMEPSASAASALTVMSAGATALPPEAGAVRVTVGAVFSAVLKGIA